ncbi:hypothetical protein LQE22_004289 [Klebsiella oxytoca]
MTDTTELAGVPKYANQHRLSRLIIEAPNDELRQMAVEVEQYTVQLIEALEKAQHTITEMDNRIRQQNRNVCELFDDGKALRERIAELERYRTAYMEWSNKTDWMQGDKRFDVVLPLGKHRADVLKAYIDRLESRTVTIEPFRSFVTDADLAALHRFAECCDDPESGGHDLEKEQVRRLEAIGALQRSGRISYITGFGDVLISITAGIKWEAE